MSEVVGWRGWALRTDLAGDGPVLISPYRCTPWLGPVLVADRKPRRWNCHGIYAVQAPHDPRIAWEVQGEVTLLGQVVVGETGYRAERAMIRSLYLAAVTTFMMPPAWVESMREALGQRYGVEVGTYDAIALRPHQPPPLGVLRLLDVKGQVLDSAPYFGGPVRFRTAAREVVVTGTRLDLSTGQQHVGWLPKAIWLAKGNQATITIHGWAP